MAESLDQMAQSLDPQWLRVWTPNGSDSEPPVAESLDATAESLDPNTESLDSIA
jgi:hypothetical protein